MKKYYQKEEEFLDECPSVAGVVVKILKGAWEPDYECDDETRRKRDYFSRYDELPSLVFDGAALYYDQNNLSSVQVILKSSNRVVTVRVVKNGDDFEAEIIVDRKRLLRNAEIRKKDERYV